MSGHSKCVGESKYDIIVSLESKNDNLGFGFYHFPAM